jgi:hypothetical protein
VIGLTPLSCERLQALTQERTAVPIDDQDSHRHRLNDNRW